MRRIVLIVPYFGNWPLWFDAFLISVKANPSINWLCVSDCEIPNAYPENIEFIKTTLPELNQHVNKIVDTQVPLNPRKFCDLKPAYAQIFSEYILDYDFWGFCDMDIIWGDIRKFILENTLKEYDIISSRKENISGHFSLFRNTEQLNSLYKLLPNYRDLFRAPEFKWTDEGVLSNFIKYHQDFKSLGLKVYWPTILCNEEEGRDSHQEYHLDKWLWQNGKMLELKDGKPVDEIMYLHFINWKSTMKFCEIEYSQYPDQFFISYNGLHFEPHSRFKKALNGFKNLLDGYRVREYRRIKRKKYKSFLNRMKK